MLSHTATSRRPDVLHPVAGSGELGKATGRAPYADVAVRLGPTATPWAGVRAQSICQLWG